jgi:hypothetical protein
MKIRDVDNLPEVIRYSLLFYLIMQTVLNVMLADSFYDLIEMFKKFKLINE